MTNESEAGDKFYDDAAGYRPAFRPGADRLRDATGIGADEAEQHIATVAAFAADARLSVPVAQRIHGQLVSALLSPPDQQTVNQWAAESRRMAREEFGEFGEHRLRQAQAFVQARPEIAEVLDATGFSSHPDLVRALIENSNGLRMEPRKR